MKRLSKKFRLFATMLMGASLCVGILGCQPQPISSEELESRNETSEQSEAAATLPTEWTPESNCDMCHTAEVDSLTNDACLAGYHTANQKATCFTCHTDESTLKTVHGDMTGKIPTKLKETEVDATICNSCHTEEEFNAVASSDVFLTDEKGTQVNPHALPATETHAAITCTDCHTGHQDGGYLQTAQEYCVSCHHENVFECGTCH